MTQNKSRLGRGLGALLDDIKTTAQSFEEFQAGPANPVTESSRLKEIPISQLARGQCQPRKNFDEQELNELAESIRAQGILQPLLVRRIDGAEYEIVAGERRWRAAQLVGLDTVPAIIRDIDDQAAMAAALVENIQRKDLNVLEIARGVKRLLKEFKLTHDEVSGIVGCSRSHITNLLRLLNLEKVPRDCLEAGKLEMGHGRALLALPKNLQQQAAERVVDKALSVRQTEVLVKQLLESRQPANTARKTGKPDQDIANLEERLSQKIGAKVDIKQGANKGKVIIHYHSLDELDGIIERIK